MRIVLALLLLLIAPAAAQAPTDRELALSTKLLSEINDGLGCRTETLGLRRQVEMLQAELTKLKEPPK